jgi:hypothetical protein
MFSWLKKLPLWGKIILVLCTWPVLAAALIWFKIKNKLLRNTVLGVWILFSLVVIGIGVSLTPSNKPSVAGTKENLQTPKVEQTTVAEKELKKDISPESKNILPEEVKQAQPLPTKVEISSNDTQNIEKSKDEAKTTTKPVTKPAEITAPNKSTTLSTTQSNSAPVSKPAPKTFDGNYDTNGDGKVNCSDFDSPVTDPAILAKYPRLDGSDPKNGIGCERN